MYYQTSAFGQAEQESRLGQEIPEHRHHRQAAHPNRQIVGGDVGQRQHPQRGDAGGQPHAHHHHDAAHQQIGVDDGDRHHLDPRRRLHDGNQGVGGPGEDGDRDHVDDGPHQQQETAHQQAFGVAFLDGAAQPRHGKARQVLGGQPGGNDQRQVEDEPQQKIAGCRVLYPSAYPARRLGRLVHGVDRRDQLFGGLVEHPGKRRDQACPHGFGRLYRAAIFLRCDQRLDLGEKAVALGLVFEGGGKVFQGVRVSRGRRRVLRRRGASRRHDRRQGQHQAKRHDREGGGGPAADPRACRLTCQGAHGGRDYPPPAMLSHSLGSAVMPAVPLAVLSPRKRSPIIRAPPPGARVLSF